MKLKRISLEIQIVHTNKLKIIHNGNNIILQALQQRTNRSNRSQIQQSRSVLHGLRFVHQKHTTFEPTGRVLRWQVQRYKGQRMQRPKLFAMVQA